MAFWNKWPYTTLQNLNLDWILTEIRKLREEGLTLVDIREDVDKLEGQVSTALQQGVTNASNISNLRGSDVYTAKNSDALGDKKPEYYLPTVNMLVNSDWRENHFIAQAGINGTHGGTPYLGDRWKNSGDITAILTNTGIQLTSTDQFGFVHQYISKLTIGTTYTVAIRRRGTGYSRLAVLNTTLSTTYASDIGYKDLLILNFTATTENVRIVVYPSYTDGGGTATFWEPVLYEGTYTADTLPPYLPPDPMLDLMKCKYRYQEYQFATWTPIGSGFSSNATAAYLIFVLETPLAHDVNVSVKMTGNILYRVNGKTYNIDASTGTVLNHNNTLTVQFNGLSIDSSDINCAGFFINAGNSVLTVAISADQ